MKFLRTGLVAALLSAWLAPPITAFAGKGEPQIVEPAKPLGAFALKDHRGRGFSKAQLEGKWSLVMLGFTQCPDICPFTLQNLTLVMEELSTRVSPDRRPQVVFIGVDPARDQPVIGDYTKAFSPDFLGVTGEWPEIEKLVEAMEGFVRIDKKGVDDTAYQVFHSAFVAVVDPEGRIAARLNPPMEPSQTAAFIANLMRQYVKAIN